VSKGGDNHFKIEILAHRAERNIVFSGKGGHRKVQCVWRERRCRACHNEVPKVPSIKEKIEVHGLSDGTEVEL